MLAPASRPTRWMSLLDEAPESEHERIHELLDRYDTLMGALVN
ncbi:MAG: hypothetical protein Q8L54_08130 [Devosia sp.]|nr:hypothetical protein [Devosia sp.]